MESEQKVKKVGLDPVDTFRNQLVSTSEEDIKKYKKLQAQEAWIKMNKETLDRMEKHKNGLLRILVYVSLVNFIINLLSLLL